MRNRGSYSQAIGSAIHSVRDGQSLLKTENRDNYSNSALIMATTYQAIKSAAIHVVDDFTPLDVVAQYGTKYGAKTKLPKIGLASPVLAVMPARLNKVMRNLAGASWRPVGPIDLVGCATIGDVILLACGQSGAKVPTGEPT